MKKFSESVMNAIGFVLAILASIFMGLVVLLLPFINPLVVTGLVMLAAFLFGFSISFAKAFGVWIILCIIKWVFSNGN